MHFSSWHVFTLSSTDDAAVRLSMHFCTNWSSFSKALLPSTKQKSYWSFQLRLCQQEVLAIKQILIDWLIECSKATHCTRIIRIYLNGVSGYLYSTLREQKQRHCIKDQMDETDTENYLQLSLAEQFFLLLLNLLDGQLIHKNARCGWSVHTTQTCMGSYQGLRLYQLSVNK